MKLGDAAKNTTVKRTTYKAFLGLELSKMDEASKVTTNSDGLLEVVLTCFKVYDFLILKINVIGTFNNNSSFDYFRPPDTSVMNV